MADDPGVIAGPGQNPGAPRCLQGWCRVAAPGGLELGLRSVHVQAADDVWIAGRQGTILRGAPGRISPMESPVAVDLNGSWSGGGEAWAVGARGTLPRHTDAWRTMSSSTTSHLDAVFGTAPDDVWIGGDDGVVLHWNGESLEPFEHDCGDPAWTSGSTANHLLRFDGADVTCTRDGRIYAIDGTGPDDVWLLSGNPVGGGGFHSGPVIRIRGEERTTHQVAQVRFSDLWIRGTDAAWLAGPGGLLHEHRGGAWFRAPDVPWFPDVNAIDGAPGGAAWVVGEGGFIAVRPEP